MAERCELVVVLSGTTEAASRLAGAYPGVPFETTPAPSDDDGGGTDSRYLTARMEDRPVAEELARRIGGMAGIRAAYVKPGGQPPG